MAKLIMDAADAHEFKQLGVVGGLIQFIARRCIYLLCNPDGRTGQSVEMTDGLRQFEDILNGALAEVLLSAGREPVAEWGAPWHFATKQSQSEGPQTTMTMRFVWKGEREPSGVGFKVLRAISSRLEVVEAGSRVELLMEIEVTPLASAFRELSQHL